MHARLHQLSIQLRLREMLYCPFCPKSWIRLLATQCTAHLDEHGRSFRLQSGFMLSHPTETVVNIMKDVCGSSDGDEVIALVLIDLSLAFDTVDHKILLS